LGGRGRPPATASNPAAALATRSADRDPTLARNDPLAPVSTPRCAQELQGRVCARPLPSRTPARPAQPPHCQQPADDPNSIGSPSPTVVPVGGTERHRTSWGRIEREDAEPEPRRSCTPGCGGRLR
jgi:hypothetical protein